MSAYHGSNVKPGEANADPFLPGNKLRLGVVRLGDGEVERVDRVGQGEELGCWESQTVQAVLCSHLGPVDILEAVIG